MTSFCFPQGLPFWPMLTLLCAISFSRSAPTSHPLYSYSIIVPWMADLQLDTHLGKFWPVTLWSRCEVAINLALPKALAKGPFRDGRTTIQFPSKWWGHGGKISHVAIETQISPKMNMVLQQKIHEHPMQNGGTPLETRFFPGISRNFHIIGTIKWDHLWGALILGAWDSPKPRPNDQQWPAATAGSGAGRTADATSEKPSAVAAVASSAPLTP